MSYEYDSEYDSEDEHNMEQIIQEVDKDDNETDFSFWMSEQGLNMPIETWASSSRQLPEKIKIHPDRLDKLTKATEYYVAVYGGSLQSVLAEMIHTFK